MKHLIHDSRLLNNKYADSAEKLKAGLGLNKQFRRTKDCVAVFSAAQCVDILSEGAFKL